MKRFAFIFAVMVGSLFLGASNSHADIIDPQAVGSSQSSSAQFEFATSRDDVAACSNADCDWISEFFAVIENPHHAHSELEGAHQIMEPAMLPLVAIVAFLFFSSARRRRPQIEQAAPSWT